MSSLFWWYVGFPDWPLKSEIPNLLIMEIMTNSKKLAKWLGWAVVVAALIVSVLAWMDV